MVTNFENLTVDSFAKMVGGILEDNVSDCNLCPFDKFCSTNEHVTCHSVVKKWANSKTSILDEVEKKYLKGVLAPWLKRKNHITIEKVCSSRKYLCINVMGEEINLPFFCSDEMYKGMEANKVYTVEELGLK